MDKMFCSPKFKFFYPASKGFFLAGFFSMYKVVRVSCISRSRLVYFPERNFDYEPLTFLVEHALDRNQVTVDYDVNLS